MKPYTVKITKVFRLKTMTAYYRWDVYRGDWKIVSSDADTEQDARENAETWMTAMRACEGMQASVYNREHFPEVP